jgi:hypothetical protein
VAAFVVGAFVMTPPAAGASSSVSASARVLDPTGPAAAFEAVARLEAGWGHVPADPYGADGLVRLTVTGPGPAPPEGMAVDLSRTGDVASSGATVVIEYVAN